MKVLTIGIFLLILGITLGITYWAAKRTKTASEFYTAGRSLSAPENGLALAGDWMSAARGAGERSPLAIRYRDTSSCREGSQGL